MVNKQKLNPLPKLSNFALEIENLNFCYHPDKPRVLKDINIRITPGQYVTVIGHNGSGKSTLSKLITGVLRYQTGTIKIFGHPITPRSIAEIRQFLGIVFQNPDNQFIGSTVMDDVAFGLECRQVPQHLMESMIIQALAKVKMTKFLDFEP